MFSEGNDEKNMTVRYIRMIYPVKTFHQWLVYMEIATYLRTVTKIVRCFIFFSIFNFKKTIKTPNNDVH